MAKAFRRQEFEGELGRQLADVEEAIERRAIKIGLYDKGVLVRPRDNSTEESMKAMVHNLTARIYDVKYLSLQKQRSALLDSIHHQGMVEMHNAWMTQEVPTGTYR